MIGNMNRCDRIGRIAAAALLACAATAHAQQSTAAAVYESVAPAVVFVETAGGTGSGLLLKSNAILTAAHVMYPYRSARVVFSHGTELLDVPLIGWDLMADVAVLGPVQSEVPSPPIGTASKPSIGSDLFTIGYPGEEQPYPQPAISRGVLSRYRHWPDQEITYLQTDALVDGGQSGGVLVSSDGAVVGMTIFGDFGHFAEADETAQDVESVTTTLDGTPPFLLIVEQFMEDAADVVIEADAALTPVADPDDGAFLDVPASRAAALDYPYDVDYFHIPLRAGETVRIRVDSTAIDPYLTVDYRFSDDVISDDDSGGGVFGVGSELVLRADHDRTYRVVIDGIHGDEMGGYALTIEPEDR